MSNIDLSLDAIIAKTKKTGKIRGQAKPTKSIKRVLGKIGGGIKKKTMGVSKNENLFTKAVPTGKWKHDKFASLEPARPQTVPSSGLKSFVTTNKKVRLNVSNLAPTVTTADLKELFSSYPFDSAVVHYGETGEHLGTGEITMKKNDAQEAIDDFKGVAVDGSRIHLAIVEGGAGASIFDRVQIVKKVGGGAIKQRSVNARPQKARAGKKSLGASPKGRIGKKTSEGRLFSLDIANVKNSSKGRGKGGVKPKKSMNEEELDAELNEGKKVLAEGVSLVGKIAVVTGANSGIGLETVKELNLRGAKVYMLCRSEQRAEEAKKKIVEAGCDASRLIFAQCDLSKFASVRACGKRLNEAESHIDILINNAGIMFYPQFELTEDGHEMTWQSDHLGPFLLTELLLPLVKNAEEGRIVNLSSAMHLKQNGRIDLSTVDDKSSFSRFAPYNRSKMANVMHARELTRRFAESGVKNVTANSLHPGVIATDLSRHLPFPATWTKAIKGIFLKSEEEGAQTTLFLAMAKEVKGVSGGYYADCARAKENPAALDDAACKKLYEYSMKAVGLE